MLIPGVVHIIGEPDGGKTTLALECGAQPDRMLLVDDDQKSREIARELGIDYRDLVELGKGKRELEFHELCLQIIDEIKPDQYDAIIWDTWTRFAKTCHAHVLKNLAAFKLNWSTYGPIKGAQQWQQARLYEAQILHHLQQLAPFVGIITHLRKQYSSKVETDKEEPDCSQALVRVCNFRIWLRHNPNSPVPIGLVLKRVDKKIVTDDGLRTVSILPRKIVPLPNEQSLWESIARYFKDPVGLRQPTEEETPNRFELSILDGTLTQDQRYTLNLTLRANAAIAMSRVETSQESNIDVALVARAREMHQNGRSFATIASETGLLVPQVVEICND